MQNCDYVARRDALIPRAVAHANRAAGTNPLNNDDRDAWNRAFHAKMNDLARPLTTGEAIQRTKAVKGRA
jgi:hypothetical protein